MRGEKKTVDGDGAVDAVDADDTVDAVDAADAVDDANAVTARRCPSTPSSPKSSPEKCLSEENPPEHARHSLSGCKSWTRHWKKSRRFHRRPRRRSRSRRGSSRQRPTRPRPAILLRSANSTTPQSLSCTKAHLPGRPRRASCRRWTSRRCARWSRWARHRSEPPRSGRRSSTVVFVVVVVDL